MGQLLHRHDPHFRYELVGVLKNGLAQLDDGVPVTQVGTHLGLVHQGVPDQVRIAGPDCDLLCHTSPERGSVHVARILVQPADERRVCRARAQQRAPCFTLGGPHQLVDELVLGRHRPDQVMRAQKHVGPVVPLQLLLEVVDQGRVDVLRSERARAQCGRSDGGEGSAAHLLLLVMVGANPTLGSREAKILGPMTESVVENHRGLFGRPAWALPLPAAPRTGGDREMAFAQEVLPMPGERVSCGFNAPPPAAQACGS